MYKVFPAATMRDQRKLKEFECRKDDVWVASFPKCGRSILCIKMFN